MDYGDFMEMVMQSGLTRPDLEVVGSMTVGGVLTARYRRGAGTLIFTRTPIAGGAAVDIGTAVASGTTYTVQLSDRGYVIGARPVTYLPPNALGAAIPVTVPAKPTITAITAGDGSVTVTFTRNSDDGGSPVLSDRTDFLRVSDNVLVGQSTGVSPATINGVANNVALYAQNYSINAKGISAASDASNAVTPIGIVTATQYAIASNRFALNQDWGVTGTTFTSAVTGDTTGIDGGGGAQTSRYYRVRRKFTTTWAPKGGRFLWSNRTAQQLGIFNGKFNITLQRCEVRDTAGTLIDTVKWGGNATKVLAPAEDIWNDPIANLNANTTYFLDLWYQLPDGGACPTYSSAFLDQEHGAEAMFDLSGSAMGAANSFGASLGGKFGPVCFVAKGCPAGTPVFGVFGDSIEDYTSVCAHLATARGDVGFIKQALGSTVNGGPWNYVSLSRSSQASAAAAGGSGISLDVASWFKSAVNLIQSQPVFNVIIDEHMRNDLGSADTLATFKTKKNTMWANLRRMYGANMPIFKTTAPPWTSAANYTGWTTLADQSVNAASSTAQVYFDSISWMLAGADGQLNGCWDTGAAVRSDEFTTFAWKIGGTSTTLKTAITANSTNVVNLPVQLNLAESIILDVGDSANMEAVSGSNVYTVASVASDGSGGYNHYLIGGRSKNAVNGLTTPSLGSRVVKAHAAGVAVATCYTSDGLHPNQNGHNAMQARIEAGKAAIVGVILGMETGANTNQLKLATLNWTNPNTADKVQNSTRATAGRTGYTTVSDTGVGARVVFSSFANGNTGDAAIGTSVGQVSMEMDGIVQLLKRNGSTTITVTAGESDPMSDEIDWTPWGITDGQTPVNKKIYFKYDFVRADSTTASPAGQVIAQDSGNSCWIYNPDTVTAKGSLTAAGPMTLTASANIYTRTSGIPFMLVHRPVNPATYKAVLFYGASQADGGTDSAYANAATVSGRGFKRVCVGASGNFAGGTCATSGNATASMTGTNTLTYFAFKYFTHVLVDLGGNDIGALNGSTDRTKYDSVEVILRNLWNTIRVLSPGVKIIHLVKPPCITATSDNLTTLEGQTVGTEWGMYNGSNGTTTGRGDLYRQWGIEQVNTLAPSEFTGVITNTQLAVSGVNSAKRRPAKGDIVYASGYPSGTIVSISADADQDGNGTYGVNTAVPSVLSSRAMTSAIPRGAGVDFAWTVPTAPGRRDLWPIATSTGWGLPGDAPIGLPANSAGTFNHMESNHYAITAKQMRSQIFGITD